MVTGYLERFLLYPTHFVSVPEEPTTLPSEGQRIWRETAEGRVEAWYLPPPERNKKSPAVILAHGNAEAIDYSIPLATQYRQLGYAVLMPEYRGYGRSEGSPGKRKIINDFKWFHDQLAEKEKVYSNRIVFHGRSLGGGVLCSLARHRPPRKLVLQSSFTSIADLAWQHYFAPEILISQNYSCSDVVSEFDRPVLIIHGDRDQIIPFEHAEVLHEKASNSDLVRLPNCGHNNCRTPIDKLKSFLNQPFEPRETEKK